MLSGFQLYNDMKAKYGIPETVFLLAQERSEWRRHLRRALEFESIYHPDEDEEAA